MLLCDYCNTKAYFLYISSNYLLYCNDCAIRLEYKRCTKCKHFYKDYIKCPICYSTDILRYNLLRISIVNQLDYLFKFPINNEQDKETIFCKSLDLINDYKKSKEKIEEET